MQRELLTDEKIKSFGFDPHAENKAASFALSDDQVLLAMVRETGLDVMPIGEAIERLPEVREKYFWKLVSPEEDEVTKKVNSVPLKGLFARARKGSKVFFPLQACYILRSEAFSQIVHNVIVAEEGSEVHIITGCLTSSHVSSGTHYAVTEIFIERGATLSYSMFHSWAPQVEVFPKSAILVEERGVYISNYVTLREVKIVKAYPRIIVKKNGIARSFSVIYAPRGAFVDIGSRIILEGENSKGESISRAVSAGGKVISRASLEGIGVNCRGHVECHGVLLEDGGIISAVPELTAFRDDVELSHEAAVGKLSEEELMYLEARGLSEEEAKSLIVRGFMKVEIPGLPTELKREMDRLIDLTVGGGRV
ncbi:MAG: SufD family Fe-S cluster assembly protein [Synergistetes bacterium]|nr:SufD family Fe-S cluster assembly protein [Synergistota bacterium]